MARRPSPSPPLRPLPRRNPSRSTSSGSGTTALRSDRSSLSVLHRCVCWPRTALRPAVRSSSASSVPASFGSSPGRVGLVLSLPVARLHALIAVCVVGGGIAQVAQRMFRRLCECWLERNYGGSGWWEVVGKDAAVLKSVRLHSRSCRRSTRLLLLSCWVASPVLPNGCDVPDPCAVHPVAASRSFFGCLQVVVVAARAPAQRRPQRERTLQLFIVFHRLSRLPASCRCFPTPPASICRYCRSLLRFLSLPMRPTDWATLDPIICRLRSRGTPSCASRLPS